MIYRFRDCSLNTSCFELRRAGRRVQLEPKVFDVLLYLIQHRDRVVLTTELLGQVWPRSSVGASALVRCIMMARRAVGDNGRNSQIIQVEPTRGYRFIAPVEEQDEERPTYLSETESLVSRGQPTLSAQPQRVRWGPNDKRPAGIAIDSRDGPLIQWSELKREIEERLFNQLGRYIPVNCTAMLKDGYGQKDWLVRIISPHGEEVGGVWFGSNPANDGWIYDGLVHVGKPLNNGTAEVWQTFQRFSDGTYRRVRVEK